MRNASRWMKAGAPLTLLLAAATALSVSAITPVAQAQGDGEAPHPTHIHTGTCDNLGDVVFPLTDVRENTAGESFGATDAYAVEVSETDVPAQLSAILSAPHAINIHESAENIQNYIACGNIGGRVVDGDLLIGLREINGSGHSGVARLESDDDDDDDDDLDVYIYLAAFGASAAPADSAATDDAASDAAATADTAATDDAAASGDTTPTDDAATDDDAATTDTAAAPAAAEVPVDIRDFAYGPNPVEVPVGGTVTWTNQDAVPHTATADQRDVLQSGTIAAGASFSQTFDTAGEFNYFCEFHPNMLGTIVVQ